MRHFKRRSGLAAVLMLSFLLCAAAAAMAATYTSTDNVQFSVNDDGNYYMRSTDITPLSSTPPGEYAASYVPGSLASFHLYSTGQGSGGSAYTDAGIVLYANGGLKLGDLKSISVSSTGAPVAINIWFDTSGDGKFFAFDSTGMLTSTNGDSYGGCSGATLDQNSAISPLGGVSTGGHTLAELQAGAVPGIDSNTPIAIWVGIDSTGSSISADISSVTVSTVKSVMLEGPADPSSAQGSDGDFYINTTAHTMFGPKTAGAWGAGTSLVGPQGPQGPVGPAGSPGAAGADGTAATVAVGNVTTGAPGSSATVTNSGNANAAVFDFTIPQGPKGDKGDPGPAGYSESQQVLQDIQSGGSRLAATQNGDGGWGWELTGSSAQNTVAPIAMGLAHAYLHTNDAAQLAALQKAGAFLLAKTNNFAMPDGYLAAQLDSAFGGTTYRDFVRTNFYGKLAAGTYMAGSAGPYDTAGYIAYRTAYRGGAQQNLAAWDFGMALVSAASVGGVDTAPWIQAVEDRVNALNYSTETTGNHYEVIGLAGAVYGLSFVHQDFDPTSGDYASASNLNDLAAALAGYQINGGGFPEDSHNVTSGNEDPQTTAYAVLALNQAARSTYYSKIQGAVNYLMGAQLATGGWMSDTPTENNEVTGETLWAISSGAPFGLQGAQGAQGPQGPAGPAGADGAAGPAGPAGTNGANGTNGVDGVSVTGTSEPAGANCPAGGMKYTSASGVNYVCNGQNGTGGASSTSWTDGMGVVSTIGHNVGIGTASPTSDLQISEDGFTNPTIILDGASDNSTTKGMIIFHRARGSHSAPTAVQADDFLGVLGVNAYDGSAYEGDRGFFLVTASENWTPTAAGYRFIFKTRSNGTVGAPTERMRIENNGNVGIGTTTPTQSLEVNGGVRLNTVTTKPACDWNTRGTFWVVQGATDDTVQVCVMSGGVLWWKTVSIQ